MRRFWIRRWAVVLGVAGGLLLSCGTAREEEAALSAAFDWLALVDQTEYSQSWDASSPLFQKSVGRDAWIESLEQARLPLGPPVARSVGRSEYRTRIPGAPDGEYVLIRFVTQFEGRDTTVERVTASSEQGVWKVSGYYVQ